MVCRQKQIITRSLCRFPAGNSVKKMIGPLSYPTKSTNLPSFRGWRFIGRSILSQFLKMLVPSSAVLGYGDYRARKSVLVFEPFVLKKTRVIISHFSSHLFHQVTSACLVWLWPRESSAHLVEWDTSFFLDGRRVDGQTPLLHSKRFFLTTSLEHLLCIGIQRVRRTMLGGQVVLDILDSQVLLPVFSKRL